MRELSLKVDEDQIREFFAQHDCPTKSVKVRRPAFENVPARPH